MNIRRVQQISESHCGPAVLEMLLDGVGIHCDQELITKATGAEETIIEEGTRIDELALAATRIAPEVQFWYKFHSSVKDIQDVLNKGYPVAVEWQGLFYDSEKEEKNHGYHGHYSVITKIDESTQSITVQDPYIDYAHFDRVFPISTFVRRWWDTNNVTDPTTGNTIMVEDVRALFFITPLNEQFSQEYEFQRYSAGAVLYHIPKI